VARTCSGKTNFPLLLEAVQASSLACSTAVGAQLICLKNQLGLSNYSDLESMTLRCRPYASMNKIPRTLEHRQYSCWLHPLNPTKVLVFDPDAALQCPRGGSTIVFSSTQFHFQQTAPQFCLCTGIVTREDLSSTHCLPSCRPCLLLSHECWCKRHACLECEWEHPLAQIESLA